MGLRVFGFFHSICVLKPKLLVFIYDIADFQLGLGIVKSMLQIQDK